MSRGGRVAFALERGGRRVELHWGAFFPGTAKLQLVDGEGNPAVHVTPDQARMLAAGLLDFAATLLPEKENGTAG